MAYQPRQPFTPGGAKPYNKPAYVNRHVLQDASGLIQVYEYTAAAIAVICDKATGQAWSENFRSVKAAYQKLTALGGQGGWLFWRNNPGTYAVLNQFIQLVNSTPGRNMVVYSEGLQIAVEPNFDLSHYILPAVKNTSPPAVAVFPTTGVPTQQAPAPTIQGLQIAGIPTGVTLQQPPQFGFTPQQALTPVTLDGAHIIKPASPIQLPKERPLSAIITELYDRSQDLNYEERVESVNINGINMVLLSGINDNVLKLIATYDSYNLVINIQVGMFTCAVLQPPQ